MSTAAPPPRPEVVCPACGTRFVCEPAGDCWCFHVEIRLPVPKPGSDARCLCPVCLAREARR